MKYTHWWLFGGLFILYTILAMLTPFPVWDEMGYLMNARDLLSDSPYTEDWRFPGLEYALVGWWLIVGESLFTARLFVILCSIGTTGLLLWWLQRRMPRLAYPLALTFALNPLMLQWSIVAYAELPSLLFAMASFALFSEGKEKWAIAAGICSAVMVLFRFPMGIFALVLAAVLAWNRQWKMLLRYALGIGVVIVPWLLWEYQQYGIILWHLREYLTVVANWTPTQSPLVQIANFVIVFTILIPFLFLGIRAAWHQKLEWRFLVILIISIALYLLFGVQWKPSRYWLMILPFAFLIIALGMKHVKNPWTWGSIAIILALAIGIPPIAHRVFCDADHPILQASRFLNGQTGGVVSNAWPYFAYWNNFPITPLVPNAPLPPNGLIAYDNSIGTAFPEETLAQFPLVKEFSGRCGQQVRIFRLKPGQ